MLRFFRFITTRSLVLEDFVLRCFLTIVLFVIFASFFYYGSQAITLDANCHGSTAFADECIVSGYGAGDRCLVDPYRGECAGIAR